MGIVYILMALAIALSITTVSFQNKGYLGVKFLLKALASFSFMAMGLAAVSMLPRIENWHVCVLAALLCGLMGDVFLSTRGIVKSEYVEPLLLAGMLFFLIGHIIYIIVFLSLAKSFIAWLAVFLAVIPIIIFLLIKRGAMSPSKAKLPVLVYSFIIGGMFLVALNYILKTRASAQAVIIFVGAILFMLSDLLLGFYNFGNFEKDSLKGHVVAFVYLPTYYIAQTLFALSMVI
ncbi:MAG: lysoplasmalogenase [Clostridia bacterium]|nr:lysoplasmalogenase [Clostridia bacterium]